MITEVAFTTVNVADQRRAKAFYTEILGLEVRRDEPMGPPDGPRWLEVAPPGAVTRLVLFHAPDQISPFSPYVLNADDLVRTCAELEAKGVEIVEAAARSEWGGWWARIKDSEGNVIGMSQESGTDE